MDDRAYWTRKLREAEAELEAATRRIDINLACKRLMLAKRELKRLEQGTGRPVPPSAAWIAISAVAAPNATVPCLAASVAWPAAERSEG